MALIDTQALIKHFEQQAEKYTLLKEAADTALHEVVNAILATEAELKMNSESTTKQLKPIKSADPTDWSNAPEWANWKATDKDGKAYWYQCEPYPYTKNAAWLSNEGKYTLAPSPNYDWDRSLEHRPT